MRWLFTGLALIVAATVPVDAVRPAEPHQADSPRGTVRIVLVGDVMVGRGVGPVLEREPDAVFAGVRHILTGADLTAANLESPLTLRLPSDPDRHDLRGDPTAAEVLAAAGFDVLAIANNHIADAGPGGVRDTIAAIAHAGLSSVGAGGAFEHAARPVIVDVEGTTVGFLAFDATGRRAGDGGSVHSWSDSGGPESVRNLAGRVDVVVVGVHGGSEYLPTTDPYLAALATTLVRAGAHVVWGHGAHVVQPVAVASLTARPAVVATSLGNFLFDQVGDDRTTGALLEILVDADGVVAHRQAATRHRNQRVELVEWLSPTGDAAWFDGSWWSIVRKPPSAPSTAISIDGFRHGDLTAAAAGDLTGDGRPETVAAFRRPFEPTAFSALRPDRQWFDSLGRSAHVGVYRGQDLEEVWVAGTVLHPVGSLQVCDGGLSLLHTGMDGPAPDGVAAWSWTGFGFATSTILPAHDGIACADLDGDGRTEPVALAR